MHTRCIYPAWALLKLLQSILPWTPLSNRTEWGYCNTSNFFQTHVCQTFVFSQMPVCWEGRKCPFLYSNLAVNSKIATIGDSLGFDILRVCHRFCCGAVGDCSPGLSSRSVSGVSVPSHGAMHVSTLSTGPMAILCNSSLDLQRIVLSEGMCPGQAGTLEYTTEAHHALCCNLCGVWRIDRRGTGEKERDREKENSLGCPSCNNFSDGEVQNSICSVLPYSQPCHLSKTIWTAEKTFRRDHTGPLRSRLVANPCPASLELLCCLCSATASEETERNMLTQFTVTVEGS